MAFIKILELISLSEINNVVKYNPISGEFTWLKSYGARKIGGTAGTITTSGYLRIFINGRHYAAHRLAWIITFGVEPEGIIDHINGISRLGSNPIALPISTTVRTSRSFHHCHGASRPVSE
jgi:hypothetical protein